VRTFVAGFFPWSLIALVQVLDARRIRPTRPLGARVLWLWTIVVVAFFSVARFKFDHYMTNRHMATW